MDVCRICLAVDPDKHINQLKTSKKDGCKGYLEIIPFCLDIQIPTNCQQTQKLCTKCFKKILTFYKFKSMALKNDAYLKSVPPETHLKLKLEPIQEVQVLKDMPRKLSDMDKDNDFDDGLKIEVKIEPEESHVFGDEFGIQTTASDLVKTEMFDESDDKVFISVLKHPKERYNPLTSTEDHFSTDNPTLAITDSETKPKIKTMQRKNKYKLKGKPKKKNNHHQGESGVCDECGADVQNLKIHSLVHIPKQNRKQYPCPQCDKVFITGSALSMHQSIKHLGKLGHCDICNKDYAYLKEHQIAMHNKEKMKFQCEVCKLRFMYQSKLDFHMTVHTKEKAYQCDHCGKNFRTKLLLQQHVRAVHELEKNFECQHCSRSFFKKYHIMNHMRTHTKEKPFKCDKCAKTFSTGSQLKYHQYSHRTVKEFQCKLCTKTFMRPSNLRVHMRSHSSERKFPCRYCGLGFKWSYPRKKHEYEKHQKHSVTAENIEPPKTT